MCISTTRYFECNRQPIYNFILLFSDTLVLLLTDVLVFLQEKDQRFIFAAVVSLDWRNALKSVTPCPFCSWILSVSF